MRESQNWLPDSLSDSGKFHVSCKAGVCSYLCYLFKIALNSTNATKCLLRGNNTMV